MKSGLIVLIALVCATNCLWKGKLGDKVSNGWDKVSNGWDKAKEWGSGVIDDSKDWLKSIRAGKSDDKSGDKSNAPASDDKSSSLWQRAKTGLSNLTDSSKICVDRGLISCKQWGNKKDYKCADKVLGICTKWEKIEKKRCYFGVCFSQ